MRFCENVRKENNEEGKEFMSKAEGTVMLRLATVARRKKKMLSLVRRGEQTTCTALVTAPPV
ncbi:unnamed protein product [Ixodes persulcatus]